MISVSIIHFDRFRYFSYLQEPISIKVYSGTWSSLHHAAENRVAANVLFGKYKFTQIKKKNQSAPNSTKAVMYTFGFKTT